MILLWKYPTFLHFSTVMVSLWVFMAVHIDCCFIRKVIACIENFIRLIILAVIYQTDKSGVGRSAITEYVWILNNRYQNNIWKDYFEHSGDAGKLWESKVKVEASSLPHLLLGWSPFSAVRLWTSQKCGRHSVGTHSLLGRAPEAPGIATSTTTM